MDVNCFTAFGEGDNSVNCAKYSGLSGHAKIKLKVKFGTVLKGRVRFWGLF